MIGGKSVLALIPARGGSKGLPRKNVLPLGGKPLISWSIEAGLASKYVDRVVVSTEDDEILAVSRSAGADVPFVRPSALATDTASTLDVVLHALTSLDRQYDLLVLLQPTSPLRRMDDIDGCLEMTLQHGADGCVSVVRPDKSPYWMYTKNETGRLRLLMEDRRGDRRQDMPTVFALNGAVYVIWTQVLRSVNAFVTPDTMAWNMPKERSIDIDTEFDFRVASFLIGD